MQCIILAGWKRTIQSDVPDSLVDIEGRPFMEYQLELLKEYGIDNIIVCTGYHGKNIHYYFYHGKDFGVKLHFSENEFHQFGAVGAIKKMTQYLDNHFYVTYGDSYFPVNYSAIMEYFKKSRKSGLMFITKDYKHGGKGNVSFENRLIKSYDPHNWESDRSYRYINTCILNKRVIEASSFSGNQIITLEDIFQNLIQNNELLSYEISKKNIEITTSEGLEEFKEYLKNPVNFL